MTIERQVLAWSAGAVLVAALAAGAIAFWPGGEQPAPAPAPRASASPSAPAPEPEPAHYPADAAAYDLTGLPATQVYSVIPALPLDPEPGGPVLRLTAAAAHPSVPVFAVPGAAPVAQLPQQQAHDGTHLPVVEQQPSWVRVLLPARSGLPSQGVAGQSTGWLRASDITLTDNPFVVSVSLSGGGITITHNGAPVHASTEFGYGVPATPTPLGRTFIMSTFVDPGAAYTRGNPVTALAMQSPTLDGFSGASVAVTAFHYHDSRSGPVSNGCIRVDPATAQQLAALPLGTPVLITP